MKQFIAITLFLCHLVAFGQQNTLSALLWDSVNSCFSNFEDLDENGVLDYDVVDDSKNGYLQISGTWPTCGCSCRATVGAYKNSSGDYILLQSDKFLCSGERYTTSSDHLKDVLPTDFNIEHLTSKGLQLNTDKALLFVTIKIPQIGTDTKVKIELIPYGLKPIGKETLCFGYKESVSYRDFNIVSKLKFLVLEVQDDKTFECIIKGDFDAISSGDKIVIKEILGTSLTAFEGNEEIQQNIKELKQIYKVYSSLKFDELILGWDKEESRFYIKETGSKPQVGTFLEFLKNYKFWNPLC